MYGFTKRKVRQKRTMLELRVVNDDFGKVFLNKNIVCEVQRRKRGVYQTGFVVFDNIVSPRSNRKPYTVSGLPEDQLVLRIYSNDELIGCGRLSISGIILQSTIAPSRSTEDVEESENRGIIWTVGCYTGETLKLEILVKKFEMEEENIDGSNHNSHSSHSKTKKKKGRFLKNFLSASEVAEEDVFDIAYFQRDKAKVQQRREEEDEEEEEEEEEEEGEEESSSLSSSSSSEEEEKEEEEMPSSNIGPKKPKQKKPKPKPKKSRSGGSRNLIEKRLERIKKKLNERRRFSFHTQPLTIRSFDDDEDDDDDDEEEEEEEVEEEENEQQREEEESGKSSSLGSYVYINSANSSLREPISSKANLNVIESSAPEFHGWDVKDQKIGNGVFKGGVKVVQGEPFPHGRGEMKYDQFTYKGQFVDGKRHTTTTSVNKGGGRSSASQPLQFGLAVLEEGGYNPNSHPKPQQGGDIEMLSFVVKLAFRDDFPVTRPPETARIEYPNGDLYVGEIRIKGFNIEKNKWTHGSFETMKLRKSILRHGLGFMYYKNEEICVSGTFKDDILGGPGIVEMAQSGHRVIGRWKQGGMAGKSTMTFLDGSYSHGEYNKGSKIGIEHFVFSNGFELSGSWDVFEKRRSSGGSHQKDSTDSSSSSSSPQHVSSPSGMISTHHPIFGRKKKLKRGRSSSTSHRTHNELKTGIEVDFTTLEILKDTTRRIKIVKEKKQARNMQSNISKLPTNPSTGIWSPLLDEENLKKQITSILKLEKKSGGWFGGGGGRSKFSNLLQPNISGMGITTSSHEESGRRGGGVFSSHISFAEEDVPVKRGGSKTRKQQQGGVMRGETSSVDFVHSLVNNDGVLKDMNVLFCTYINQFYGYYNNIANVGHNNNNNNRGNKSNKGEDDEKNLLMRKQYIHIRSDVKSYVRFVQRRIFSLLKSVAPNLANQNTNHIVYMTLVDFLHQQIYPVLIDYYKRKYETKDKTFKQKIQSIILALYSTERAPKVFFCGKKCSKILSTIELQKSRNENKKDGDENNMKLKKQKGGGGKKREDNDISKRYTETDQQLMMIIHQCTELYRLANERKMNLTSLEEEHLIVNLMLECLHNKCLKLMDRSPFREELKHFMIKFGEKLSEFTLSDSHKSDKTSLHGLRNNIKLLRITLGCFFHSQALSLLKKVLFSEPKFHDHPKHQYLVSSINALQSGFSYLQTGKFREIPDSIVEYAKTSVQSIQEYLGMFYRKSFEQPSLIRRCVNLRVRSICEGLKIVKLRFSHKGEELDELVGLLGRMSLGNRRMKDEKMIVVFRKFKEVVFPLIGKEKEGRMLFESMHFKITGIMGLFGITKYPIGYDNSVRQVGIEIKCLQYFMQFLSLKDKREDENHVNEVLYSYVVKVLSHIESQMITQVVPKTLVVSNNQNNVRINTSVISKKNYDVIIEIKDVLNDLRNLFLSMSRMEFGIFNFLFDLLSVLVRGYNKMVKDITKVGIKGEIFRDLKNRKVKRAQQKQQQKQEGYVPPSTKRKMKIERKEIEVKEEEEKKLEQHKQILSKILTKQDEYSKSKVSSSIQSLEHFMKYLLVKTEAIEVNNAFSSVNFIRKEFTKRNQKYIIRINEFCEDLLYTSIKKSCLAIPTRTLRNSLNHFDRNSFISLEAFGLRKKFIPDYFGKNYNVDSVPDEIPYSNCVSKLYELKDRCGLLEKLKHLSDFEKTVSSTMSKISGKSPPFEEDDKLPVILYIFLMCPIEHVIEYSFLKDWNEEFCRMVARYETFINYIQNLDPYVRDGGEFLTIVGNIFSPLKNHLVRKIEFFENLSHQFLTTDASGNKNIHLSNNNNNKNNNNNNNKGFQNLNIWWLMKLLEYVYCTIGFLDKDEKTMRLDTVMSSSSSTVNNNNNDDNMDEEDSASYEIKTSRLKKKKKKIVDWVHFILDDLEQCNGVTQFLGFYIKYNTESDVLSVVFTRKYSPQIYKRIKKQIAKDKFLKDYIRQ